MVRCHCLSWVPFCWVLSINLLQICGRSEFNRQINLILKSLSKALPWFCCHTSVQGFLDWCWLLGMLATLPVNFLKWVFDCQGCYLPKKSGPQPTKFGVKWVGTAKYQFFCLKLEFYRQNNHYLVVGSIGLKIIA